ncbi:conserved hypothetical protein [Myxococcus xanthus DK 1622]|uniref:Uncharacterized protein n=1 Tax=Myxococcus xanthus (strain DK1622) TaxID=246197 RepID=Q1D8I2_MYXXD|nr:conserved hypothetical protein [Myxococcus xanthus DK 1622]
MSKQVEKQEWVRVAEAFEASGQTQKEFSAQRGVRLSTLQSWVYRRDASVAARQHRCACYRWRWLACRGRARCCSRW